MTGAKELADCHQFLDRYVAGGVDGGRLAANRLKIDLEAWLTKNTQYRSNWSLTVRLYAKFNELAETYVNAKIVGESQAVHQFFRGFNEVHPLIDAIDAGADKEGADTKIKRALFFVDGRWVADTSIRYNETFRLNRTMPAYHSGRVFR